MNTARLRVEIQGAVQGVGFRPFVYRLAVGLSLSGWVANDAQGVVIEVEGGGATLDRFLARLREERPPNARILSLAAVRLAPAGYRGFEIRQSDRTGTKSVLVLPDLATCGDCLRELFDPDDRRFGYPFANCTNCGPRFSIIEALPYDRPNTTMRRFAMCPQCGREYEEPGDRRFHAQPNACAVCGPHVELWLPTGAVAAGGSPAADRLGPGGNAAPGATAALSRADRMGPGGNAAPDVTAALSRADRAVIRAAAESVRGGAILAMKGIGGFLLLADAGNERACAALRERKGRPRKPFALMVRNLAQAGAIVEVSEAAAALLASPACPIVLLPRRSTRSTRPAASAGREVPPADRADSPSVAAGVAPGCPTLGVMLPSTPLHHLLMAEVGTPVVATSGNVSDEPICVDEREALERLGGIADLFLVHDRPIARHVDDSVAWIVGGEGRLLRRARGYAPLPIALGVELPTILGVGAHMKNAVGLSVGSSLFVSQHIGDLETPQAFDAFQRVIADFLTLYEASPRAIAHDLHPDYLSTRWAKRAASERGLPTVAVQHHHAHLAACLAENRAAGPALGVIWDGTGYGGDGTVWGGEFLFGDASRFERVAHLRPFRLPGGEAAVAEPVKVAFSLLWELYGEEVLSREDLPAIDALAPADRRILARMLATGLNSPLTTSAGRLFDGVSALLGLCLRTSFEGEAAMTLEWAAWGAARSGRAPRSGRSDAEAIEARLANALAAVEPYPFDIIGPATGASSPMVLDWRPLLRRLLADLRSGVEKDILSLRFHATLAAAIAAIVSGAGAGSVALSGGCFQNRLLLLETVRRLEADNRRVYQHRELPPNDGCIAVGQIAVASTRLG